MSGGCGAEGGDDVDRDERDAKSSKCKERRQSRRYTERVNGVRGGTVLKGGVRMQGKHRKQAFKEVPGNSL